MLDADLEAHFRTRLLVAPVLSRSLVSFQANKTRAVYRWYRYKEAFSAALVEHLFGTYGVASGPVLDPFAGSGTALFAAGALGFDADGIELLPIGHQIVEAKQLADSALTTEDVGRMRAFVDQRPWEQESGAAQFTELRITRGAYPLDTMTQVQQYLAAANRENERVRTMLRFALLCVLESISFTRKDGQYLRWDHRSGRTAGKKQFHKGSIPSFRQAITAKLAEILSDLAQERAQYSLFAADRGSNGAVRLLDGSCLRVMPTLPSASYRCIMTSPPYCNRYDYTRTYALELALLGTGEKELAALRQEMLSCTVENRGKDLLGMNPNWAQAIQAADRCSLLQAILAYLEGQREQGVLNNDGIPRMVRGYFYEMACVIAECARVLRPGSPLFMVNDNVRYAGASISVDLILSVFAEQLGFKVEQILVLPNKKGNSSQQMGAHGRDALRKCVYVWRRL